MANFKRKQRRSKTMKKCSICGSQRRLYGDKGTKYEKPRCSGKIRSIDFV